MGNSSKLLAVLLCDLAISCTGAAAASVDWSKLAANPAGYVGTQVEVSAYCASGGVNGDAPGYECATQGPVYIEVPDLSPASAKKKLDDNCGGMDVIERSSFCRATISFVPRSYTTSTELEPGKTVTVINTDAASLKF
jgi:hypothetical protein